MKQLFLGPRLFQGLLGILDPLRISIFNNSQQSSQANVWGAGPPRSSFSSGETRPGASGGVAPDAPSSPRAAPLVLLHGRYAVVSGSRGRRSRGRRRSWRPSADPPGLETKPSEVKGFDLMSVSTVAFPGSPTCCPTPVERAAPGPACVFTVCGTWSLALIRFHGEGLEPGPFTVHTPTVRVR